MTLKVRSAILATAGFLEFFLVAHCYGAPNYDFCILQGSVATLVRWGRQNYSRLRFFSSRCCLPKTIFKNRPMFHRPIYKWKRLVFL